MAAKGMYETVKQAIQDLIAPDLERIKGQLTGVDARINALERGIDARMSALEKRVDEGFRAVNDRIDTLKERVGESNKRLDEALDIRERLATLEAKFAARG
jgi:prefoldin subunit 5